MEAVILYNGHEEFTVWPKNLRMSPGCNGRVYVQYSARRRDTAAVGILHVLALGSSGSAGVVGIPGTEAIGTEVLEEVLGSMKHAGVAGSAGRWCSARVSLQAVSTTDRAHALQPHDFTDDPHLLNSIVI
ncbi:unnamed protein product [Parnassius apollo]|uniref:(apollo) hypothetical protein n=1 Tax=Parnassius apollo TaxID=110799 RepID=A0A8S3XQS2_PARAO|nr:unnamed protein product [Parnassius apollo]